MLHPWSWSSWTVPLPTFPNPCTTTRESSTAMPCAFRVARAMYMTPRAGARGPAGRPADGQRLARDHAGDGIAFAGGIGVHDPGHDLLVGPEVGGGDVALRSDEREELRGVAAGHPLELTDRQGQGIDH